jgi:8-oxo-dGTP diphosphatase
MPPIVPHPSPVGRQRGVRDSGAVPEPSSATDPDHLLPCHERSCDVVGVFLVDARGWVLLQERDEHAPVAAEQWGIVGGHVDPGEEWPAAMRRELVEETGIELPEDALELWYDGRHTPETKARPDLTNHWQVWVGRADLTDDDIVCGEGRQIVFVDPDRLDELDLAESTADFLPRFMASAAYARLSAGRSRGGSPAPRS